MQNGLTLRIATFNVENLGKSSSGGATLQERVQLLKPQLVRLRADILCLQEVDGQRLARGKKRQLMAMEALLEGTPYESYQQATTRSRSKGDVRDKHNLVILSRFPLETQRQVFHDLVSPPRHQPVTAGMENNKPYSVEWDRPLLYAAVRLDDNRIVHVLNVHLRAPRAAFLPGQKSSGRTWKSMSGWAEGFYLAAVKRIGQALEARLVVDRLFDSDRDALIAVCGDFNAGIHQVPVRTIRGDEEDAGNPHLAMRMLVPLERSLAESRRFSVVHHGRPQMLDHLLVSRPLLAWYRGMEIHNEALGDELVTAQAVRGSPESFHAPVVAEFFLAGAPGVLHS